MNTISAIQKEFFQTLEDYQEVAVNIALIQYGKNGDLEDALYSATYEVLVDLFELLDGYKNTPLEFDLIEVNSNTSLKENIQMHDVCADYLKYESKKEK